MIELPNSKTALLEQMKIGRREWENLLVRIDPYIFEEPGVEGIWSVKQIIAHIIGYEEWSVAFLTDLHDPSAGASAAFDAFWQNQLHAYRQEYPDFPADMNETNDDQTNAVVVAAYDQFSAHDVLAHERQVYQQLLTAIQALPDLRFLEPWKSGGRSLMTILPSQSYTHYQTHLPAIQKWLTERKK